MDKGKLVVIEGSDGSGKATQMKLLTDYLDKKDFQWATFDFPQYSKTFFGKWTRRFLDGEFGNIEDLPPYLLMFPYAADRWQAKAEIEKELKKGKIVICNRYAGSQAYQAAKLPEDERAEFISWSFEMEYKEFGIPQEQVAIFLHVPVDVSQKLMDGRGNGKDIHESNIGLLEEVEKVYLGFCEKYPHWKKVECVENGELLPREEIHRRVVEVLEKERIV